MRLFAITAGTVLAFCGVAAGAAEHRVTMAGTAYAPAAITAKIGDTIVFANDDDVDHMVFVPTKGHGINLGTQKPGSTAALPLRRAGSFEVECANHAPMLLKVSVQK